MAGTGRAPHRTLPRDDGHTAPATPHRRIEDVAQRLGNRAFGQTVAAVMQRQEGAEGGAGTAVLASPEQAQSEIAGLRKNDGIAPGTADKRPFVQGLQSALNEFTHFGLKPDGMWGGQTTRAVNQAQLMAGLPSADVIDQILAALLTGASGLLTPIQPSAQMLIGLRQGDGLDLDKLNSRNRVRLVQTKLCERGFPVAVDGGWGRLTQQALESFQTSAGLTPGSPIDRTTAEALMGPAQTTTIDPGSSSAIFGQVRAETRPFGSYVVVPDGTPLVDFEGLAFLGEILTETQFKEIQQLWDELVAGTGTIQVGEFEPRGNRVVGFRDKILRLIGTLMSRKTGRQVVRDIRTLGRLLLIIPGHPLDAPKGQPTSGGPVTIRDRDRGLRSKAGPGLAADSTIVVPPDLSDTSFVAFDKAGNPIAVPEFTILGHEMAHALHNAQGENASKEKPSDKLFDNLEEENAIAVENQIRKEHGIANERFGHKARRRKPTDFQ